MVHITNKHIEATVNADKYVERGDTVFFYLNRKTVLMTPVDVEITDLDKVKQPLYKFVLLGKDEPLTSDQAVACDGIQAINLERVIGEQYNTKCVHKHVASSDNIVPLENALKLTYS